MVGDKIRNITRQLRERAADGSLTVEMFRLALENLEAAADEASRLEAAAVPDAARRAPAARPEDIDGDRVVVLDDYRVERKRFGVIPGGIA